jgi:ribonuclease III
MLVSWDENSFEQGLGRLQERIGYTFADAGLLVQAMTHSSRANEEGVEVGDNERLEFLGDAALELFVTMRLYAAFPSLTEGQLTRARANIVNGTALAEVAAGLDLGTLLRLGRGEESSGGREKPTLLADCFEALCGALFIDAGYDGAARVLERLLSSRFFSGRQLVFQDPRSMLQERLQERGMAYPDYSVVEASGPEHAKTFVVEVASGGKPLGKGRGATKKEAAGRAAEDALDGIGS